MEKLQNLGMGDSMNMVETPEDSPERRPATDRAQEREMGGAFNHMAQDYEKLNRSVRNLQMDRQHSDI